MHLLVDIDPHILLAASSRRNHVPLINPHSNTPGDN